MTYKFLMLGLTTTSLVYNLLSGIDRKNCHLELKHELNKMNQMIYNLESNLEKGHRKETKG